MRSAIMLLMMLGPYLTLARTMSSIGNTDPGALGWDLGQGQQQQQPWSSGNNNYESSLANIGNLLSESRAGGQLEGNVGGSSDGRIPAGPPTMGDWRLTPENNEGNSGNEGLVPKEPFAFPDTRRGDNKDTGAKRDEGSDLANSATNNNYRPEKNNWKDMDGFTGFSSQRENDISDQDDQGFETNKLGNPLNGDKLKSLFCKGCKLKGTTTTEQAPTDLRALDYPVDPDYNDPYESERKDTLDYNDHIENSKKTPPTSSNDASWIGGRYLEPKFDKTQKRLHAAMGWDEPKTCGPPIRKVVILKNFMNTESEIACGSHSICTPKFALIHRCGGDTGCCQEDDHVCGPNKTEEVKVVFKKYNTLTQNSSYDQVAITNHTKCGCSPAEPNTPRDQGSHKGTRTKDGFPPLHRKGKKFPSDEFLIRERPQKSPPPVARANDDGFLIGRSSAQPQCRCPAQFVPRMKLDSSMKVSCTCECIHGEKLCINQMRGREAFSADDYWCIISGKCQPPNCQFGAFINQEKRCPMKSENTRRRG